MNTERPVSLDLELAHYLSKYDILRAYTLLYRFLQESDENGYTNYSRAELEFDKDGNLGRAKRNPGTPVTDAFLNKEAQVFEFSINSGSSEDIQRYIQGINSVLLLMILDGILKDEVDSSLIPMDGIYSVNGESFYLLQHAYIANKYIKANNHSGDIRLVVRWNHIIKDTHGAHSIKVTALDPEVRHDFEDILDEKQQIIDIFSAEDHRVEYLWDHDEHSQRFRFHGYKCDKRKAGILNTLKTASHSNAQIVIFPELSVSEEVREDIRVWLATKEHNLLLVIAGSWHVSTETSDYVNESIVFDKLGHVVMTHRKATTFSVKLDPSDEYPIAEDIVTSNVINLTMFPFGLTTLLICKDFCDLLSSVQDTIKHCAPEFIFLPTMGEQVTLDAHDKAYRNLSVGISPTVICSNQTPVQAYGKRNFPGRLYFGMHLVEGENSSDNEDGTLVTNGLNKTADTKNIVSGNAASNNDLFVELPESGLYRVKLRV